MFNNFIFAQWHCLLPLLLCCFWVLRCRAPLLKLKKSLGLRADFDKNYSATCFIDIFASSSVLSGLLITLESMHAYVTRLKGTWRRNMIFVFMLLVASCVWVRVCLLSIDLPPFLSFAHHFLCNLASFALFLLLYAIHRVSRTLKLRWLLHFHQKVTRIQCTAKNAELNNVVYKWKKQESAQQHRRQRRRTPRVVDRGKTNAAEKVKIIANFFGWFLW